MAVTRVAEIAGREGGQDLKLNRKYQRKFQVEVDSLVDGPAVVRFATGVPRIYSFYAPSSGEYDLGAICVDVRAVQDPEDPYFWEVTADYDSALDTKIDPNDLSPGSGGSGSTPPGQPTLPTNKPPKYQWSFERFSKPITQDRDGIAITNSADQPFDPPIEVEECRVLLRITRNELAFDPSVAIEYADVVNTEPFYGAAAGEAKLKIASAVRQFEEGMFYWEVEYEIEFNRDGFMRDVLDQGYYYLDGSNNKVLIRDQIDATAMNAPCLLDGSGGILAYGASPHYQRFRLYDSKDFTPLGL